MSTKHVTGPIQVLVIGFDRFQATGQIMAELRRVRKRGVIRLIDVLFVEKDDKGDLKSSMHLTDLSETERVRLGEVAGGLLGLRAGGVAGGAAGARAGANRVAERDAGLSADQLAVLADAIPNGSAAAIVVIEHHWAARLRDKVRDAGGRTLIQAMITPEAVALVGEELRARVEAEEAIEAAEELKLAAAMDIAETLFEAELIEEAAMEDAADAVAAARAIEDAAAADVAETLVIAGLVEREAAAEAAQAIRERDAQMAQPVG